LAFLVDHPSVQDPQTSATLSANFAKTIQARSKTGFEEKAEALFPLPQF